MFLAERIAVCGIKLPGFFPPLLSLSSAILLIAMSWDSLSVSLVKQPHTGRRENHEILFAKQDKHFLS